MDAHVVEGVVLYSDFPDSLEFSVLVLQDGSIGANTRRRGKCLSVLCCIGVGRVDDAPEFVLGMGLVVSRLE